MQDRTREAAESKVVVSEFVSLDGEMEDRMEKEDEGQAPFRRGDGGPREPDTKTPEEERIFERGAA